MYIKDLTCISPQKTITGEFFGNEPLVHVGPTIPAMEPDYADIPRGQLRRMGKSNRMATGAGMPLLQKWKTDGIIIGTTDGGMEDCHRFLNQIIQYEEGTLTPTGFVQGSPSSPAGGLALMSANSGYNNTHSNMGLSFENCVVDAQLLFDEGRANSLLIGCVEEISQAPLRISQLAGHTKSEEVSTDKLFESKTKGTAKGEGATMFVVESSPENAIAQIVDVDMITCPSEADPLEKAERFLERNGIEKDQIDALMLGYAGDVENDKWYDHFANSLFHETGIITYKNLFGENAAASSFATWFAANLVNGETAPEMAIKKPIPSALKTILIYNMYQGTQHGFVLVKSA
ncbi:MAG: beta-ketoacyl synthase chain length factor [Flavobacteriales bacterium]|nr:beta-ketoacyl synthase chain length factor [Flavobacteriales bacterium]